MILLVSGDQFSESSQYGGRSRLHDKLAPVQFHVQHSAFGEREVRISGEFCRQVDAWRLVGPAVRHPLLRYDIAGDCFSHGLPLSGSNFDGAVP
jgi:hypothetical protein